MRPAAHVVAAALLWAAALHTPPAAACGVCIEDKVAATYDYGIVMNATAKQHVVVFAQVEGPADMSALSGKIASVASRMSGVDRATIRTSASPAAFSFALDPRVRSPEAAVAQVEKRLKSPGVHLSVLRVVSRESLLPASRPKVVN
jgi:2-keto-3-deoxy-L-rhamnonate aldolase RhmA